MTEQTDNKLKLGVNIDHVATLRQARYATMLDSHNAEPILLDAVTEAEAGGADSITIHLRADRRHIQDKDVADVKAHLSTKLNLEMGNTPEILEIALKTQPDFVCLVPEHREEITTEGGLDVSTHLEALKPTVSALQDNGTAVSMFIEADEQQIEASVKLGAEMVELHTGSFANATGAEAEAELNKLVEGAKAAHSAGLQVNAGHGINTANLPTLFTVPHMAELNIGHHLVSRAITIGLRTAVKEMAEAMAAYPNG